MFDEAELYIKDSLSIPIDIGIKEINQELNGFREVPGLKLMVTGGQAIEDFFPNSPELRTHDYDLKLVAPTATNIDRNVRRVMLNLGGIIVDNLKRRLNLYMNPIINTVQDKIRKDYNVALTNQVDPFYVVKLGSSLYTVMFRMTDGTTVRQSPIVDVFVVKPSDIYHYNMFTGLQGSDYILSEGAGPYYIPYQEVSGVPHAKLGYVLWDTLRMIEYTRDLKLPKFQRYVNKRNSIIQGLNNPEEKLSCDMMKTYVDKCNKDFKSSCVINNKTYKSVDDLLTLAVSEGIIPADPQLLRRIKSDFSLNYLCQKVKKVL